MHASRRCRIGDEMAAKPERVSMVVNAIRARGPLTRAELDEACGMPAGRMFGRWLESGWLTRTADGLFDEGPRASVGAVPTSERRRRQLALDRSGEEGSNEWLVVQQLRHGPLTKAKIAELLDSTLRVAELALERLRHNGHVSCLREGRHNGVWRLVDSKESE
jgi:hypothetical protein